MAMVIAVNQHKRGPSVKLVVSVACEQGISNELDEFEVNIDDLAIVRFRFVGPDCYFQMKAEISAKKNSKQKDTMVTIKIPEIPKYLDCDDNWSGYTDLGDFPFKSNSDDVLLYVQEVSLVVTQAVHKPTPLCEMLYNDKIFTDFQLSTDDGSVPMHRTCMAAHSDVFKNLLTREWRERTDGCIPIKGLSLQTLNHLKDYMYLGALPEEDLRPLLLIANFCKIHHLKEECISRLALKVTEFDIGNLLAFASANKISDLMVAILQLTPDKVVDAAKNCYIKLQDADIEYDAARSEATVIFTVANVRNLKEAVCSPTFNVHNLPWEIRVMSYRKHKPKWLFFSLWCNTESESFVEAELRVISHKPGSEPSITKMEYRRIINGSRYHHYAKWDEVLNPGNGYIKDGAITLEVHVSVLPWPAVLLQDADIEYDAARSEATVPFTVANVRNLRKEVCSLTFNVRHLKCEISVAPHKKHERKWLMFKLQCTNESESFSEREYFVEAELRLISHKPGSEPFIMKMENRYIWSYSYAKWDAVLNPGNGYIKDGVITLEVHASVLLRPAVLLQDADMEYDAARSAATVPFTVANVRNLRKLLCSPPFNVHNLPWEIRVTTYTKFSLKKLLLFQLWCKNKSESSSESESFVEAELRLISHKPGSEPFITKMKQNSVFSMGYGWGYHNYIAWDDVLNPGNGYIEDSAITLELHVSAAPWPPGSRPAVLLRDADIEHDAARSAATVPFTVANVRNLRERVLSPPFNVHNLPWRISVAPGTDLLLEFNVWCNNKSESSESESSESESFFDAELRLISHKPDSEPFITEMRHCSFVSIRYGWRYRNCIAWDDVLNPGNGYIEDGAITLELHVSAVPWTPGNTPAVLLQEADMKYDAARSEATVPFTVANVRTLREDVWSPTFNVHNLPWRISVEADEELWLDCVLFSLCCYDKIESFSERESFVEAELRLISHKPGSDPFIMEMRYNSFDSDYSDGSARICVCEWDDVLNPDNGYITDGAITLELHMSFDTRHENGDGHGRRSSSPT